MTKCKYWDAGFCYAPDDVETSASSQSACFDYDYCPYLKSQKTDLKFTSPSGETTLKFEDTGRIGTVAPKTQLHIKMDEPMSNIVTASVIEAQIKELQSKLEFYKELEKTKSPVEEAFKRVYGHYPVTDIADTCWSGSTWTDFVNGYESAQQDYKVGEYQEPVEGPAKDVMSLYKRFENESAYGQLYYDDALKVTKEFLMDEAVIENEDHEYITFTLQKSLLEVPND